MKRGIEKNTFLILSSLSILFLLSSSVFAADVAYIYKKNHKIDQKVLDVFSEMSLTVDMINEKNLPSTFSSYKLIFIGDEKFSNAKKLPVGNVPTVIISHYHGEVFGLTDRDGVSRLASTAPLTVVKQGEEIEVYNSACKARKVSIPYLFLAKANKANSLTTTASTKKSYSKNRAGDVISYANPGSVLENGKEVNKKICFFGIIESHYWTQEAENRFKDCVNFVKATQSGEIACSANSDCGTNGYISEPTCSDDSVKRTYKTYTCNSPGTTESSCSSQTEEKTIQECENSCSNGQCVGEASCDSDADCTADGFEGNNFCSDGNVMKLYKNYTCMNPGTTESSCSLSQTNNLIETCSLGCEAGQCTQQTGSIHDVAFVNVTNTVGIIRIRTSGTDSEDVPAGTPLQCNQKYQIKVKVKNKGNFTENITLSGMVGSLPLAYTNVVLEPGTTSSERTNTINFTLAQGNYDITINAALVGFTDANPSDNVATKQVSVSCSA